VVAFFAAILLLAVPVTDACADSLREVAERVARQYDGKVIAAREVQRNGRRFYEIRILTRDGVVRTIRVPADDRRSGSTDSNRTLGRDGAAQQSDALPGPMHRSSAALSRPLPDGRTDSSSPDRHKRQVRNPGPERN
jgi:hypothetical protein